MVRESGVFKSPSKKFWCWCLSQASLLFALAHAVRHGSDASVQSVLATGMILLPITAIAGLSWVDAVVRGALARQGIAQPAPMQAPAAQAHQDLEPETAEGEWWQGPDEPTNPHRPALGGLQSSPRRDAVPVPPSPSAGIPPPDESTPSQVDQLAWMVHSGRMHLSQVPPGLRTLIEARCAEIEVGGD